MRLASSSRRVVLKKALNQSDRRRYMGRQIVDGRSISKSAAEPLQQHWTRSRPLAMTKGDLAKPVKGERYDCICASSRSEGRVRHFSSKGRAAGLSPCMCAKESACAVMSRDEQRVVRIGQRHEVRVQGTSVRLEVTTPVTPIRWTRLGERMPVPTSIRRSGRTATPWLVCGW